jgi:two-component system, cell cycle response regulator
MKALIADDDPIVRRLVEAQLTKWGYDVVVCADGSQAWEILSHEDSPRIVILDWMMPEMDGPSICKEIRRLGSEVYTYVILLTGKNRKEDIIEGLEAGADDYLTKPFDPSELKVRIRAGARIVQLQQDLIAALRASQFKANHDVLTHLLNRAAILDFLEKELARSAREQGALGIIMADVDHFKRINDRYGHLAGDAVLRETAQKILSSMRPYDAAGRYGGEEFLIVLPGCDLENAGQIAERLREDFASNHLKTGEGVFPITLSFGVTSVQSWDGIDPASVIRIADAALYQAKDRGRNRVELATSGPESADLDHERGLSVTK